MGLPVSSSRVGRTSVSVLRRTEAQQQIILTDLTDARNPSAVLLSRVRQLEASQAVPAGQPPPPSGSWGHGGGYGYGGGYGRGYGSGYGYDQNNAEEDGALSDFIQQYGLDDKARWGLTRLEQRVSRKFKRTRDRDRGDHVLVEFL